ncbi:MAG: ATP-binding protein [Coleofasciculus sp. B1-GNL1-01]|uniref:ATP-binding protein n=1 Tax=Coleofasciculus sp. B1-GNL1-01 TaxID=3068484 RepID=UPI0032F51EE4
MTTLDDELLEKLRRLSSEQFQAVVFRLKDDIEEAELPGSTASQSERAIELIRLLQLQDKLQRLNNILAEPAISIIGEQYIGYEIEAQVKGIVHEYIQQPFEGREDEQRQLDDFVQHNSQGVLLVTGAAGFGKSALLSHWQQTQQENCFIAYHCFSYRYQKTRLVSEAYRHLLKQLYLYHNIRNGQFPNDPNRMRDILVGMLEKPVSPEGKRLVIVLDGLDEASEKLEPFFTRLADGVFVIASARAEVGDEPEYLRNWTDNAQRLYLKRLRREAIPKWLAQISELVTYSQNQDFVQRLDEITGGFPLYLRYLIDDLRQAAIKCQDVQGVLRNSPGGFKAYVKEQFRQLAKVEEIKRQGEVRELFALLSVALGALSEDDIEALTALNAWDLADLPWQATRWFSIQTGCYSSDFSRHPEKSISNLTPQPPSHPSRSPLQGEMAKDASLFFARKGENSKQGNGENSKPLSLQERGLERGFPDSVKSKNYSFAHPLLAQEFKGALGRQASLAEDKLIDYCAKWQDNHSSYGLRHYAEHLGKAKRWEELYAIARDKNFSSAQQQQLSDEPDLPLKTVQAALLGAAEEDKAERMAEFVLVHAHRLGQTNAQESPLDALRSGSLKRAWVLADQYEIERCILWYLLLAWELKDTDRFKEARETLERLECKKLPRFSVHATTLWQGNYAAYFLAKLFDTNEEVCTGLVGKLFDNYHLRRLCNILREHSNFSAALETVQEISDEWDQVSQLGSIAKTQVTIGLRQAARTTYNIALEIIRKKAPNLFSVEEMGKIAKAQVEELGNPEAACNTFAEALEIAWKIRNHQDRVRAFIAMANRHVEVGMIARAFDLLQTINIQDEIEESLKIEVLNATAELEAKEGRLDNAQLTFTSAKKIAHSIEDEQKRSEALERIARAQAQVIEFLDNAFETAEEIDYLYYKTSALQEIVRVQIQAENFTAALSTISRIEEPRSKANALWGIAQAQAEANPLTDDALETAQAIEDQLQRREALVAIAKEQAKAGNFSGAYATMSRIQDRSRRQEVLLAIAYAQANAENYPTALEVAEGIDALRQIKILGFIAKKLTAGGQSQTARAKFATALQISQAFKPAYLRAIALANIAEAQVQVSLNESGASIGSIGNQIAQEIDNPREKAIAMAITAEVLAKAGKIKAAQDIFTAALETAHKIDNQSDGVISFRVIAEAQASVDVFTAALETAQKIQRQDEQAKVLAAIAKAQAKAGLVEEAHKTVNTAFEIAQNYYSIWGSIGVLCEVAVAEAAVEQKEEALELLSELRDREVVRETREQDKNLSTIAVAHIKIGEITTALEIKDEIEDEWERVKVISWIAWAEFKKGEKEGLLTTLAAALEAKGKIKDEENRVKALRAIAGIQIRAGKGEQAVRTLEKILTERNRHLPNVAAVFIETGDRANFKHLLIPCAYYLDAAYEMCGYLARLYPEKATDIANVLSEFTLSAI